MFGSALSPPSAGYQKVNGVVGRPAGAFATYCKVGWLGLLNPIHP